MAKEGNLNTSYVKVPVKIATAVEKVFVNLNTSYVKVPGPSATQVATGLTLFKYILCKGSRQLSYYPFLLYLHI